MIQVDNKYEQNPSCGLEKLLKNLNIIFFKSVNLTLRS